MSVDPAAGRRKIAKYLDANGATPGDELAEAMGMTLEAFWVLISHPWFTITGRGWAVSDRGREEALGGEAK